MNNPNNTQPQQPQPVNTSWDNGQLVMPTQANSTVPLYDYSNSNFSTDGINNFLGSQGLDDRTNVTISRLLLCEVPSHHNQYTRPFQVNTDGSVIRDLERQITKPGGLSPVGLANIPSQALAPSAQVGSPVQIHGGWEERRFLFFMEVVFETNMGINHREMISGYTDHAGINTTASNYSVSGVPNIDPNMMLIINSVFPISDTVVQLPNGTTASKPISQAQTHLYSNDKFYNSTSPYLLMTPQNVCSSISVANYAAQGNFGLRDSTPIISDFPSLSNIQFNNPNRYLSKLVNSYTSNLVCEGGVDVGLQSDVTSLTNVSAEMEQAGMYSRDKFMRLICSISGNPARSYLTWNELLRIYPGVVHNTKIILQNRNKHVWDSTNTCHMAGASIETLAAVNIANIMPSIAMDLGLTEVFFSSTNNVQGCQPQTIINKMTHFAGTHINTAPLFTPLVNKINSELIPVISNANQVWYEVSVSFSLIQNTLVEISINNYQKTMYRVPSFADSLISPVVTQNSNDFTNLTHGIEGILATASNTVEQTISQSYSPYVGSAMDSGF